MEFVELTRFQFSAEANLLKTKLESEGIYVFLKDEYQIDTDPLSSLALGSVKVLVKTMNEDPNTNVRMAALEALSKFHSDTDVRKALIHSLSIQKDPVVQIALIQMMVVMKEKSVVKDLERMSKEATMKAVKDEALAGIMRLS